MPERQPRSDFEQAREILVAGAAALEIRLSPDQIDSFLSYLSLLVKWNVKFNLTAISRADQIVRRHFLDSLALMPLVKPSGRLLDVGSGAGFPGLPLKLVLPEKEVVLVEPQRKRANFLREAIRRLKLGRVDVVEKRLEQLSAAEIGLFEEVVTRALGIAGLFLEASFPLLSPAGQSMIMQGPKGHQLMQGLEKQAAALGFHASRMEELKTPWEQVERRILIFTRKS